MDELRLERALRAGPAFATSYAARPLDLDVQVFRPAPVNARRMLTIVAVAGLLLAAVVAALVIGSRLLPSTSQWELSVQVPRGSYNHDWYRVSEDGAFVPLGEELPGLATVPTWSPDGRTLAYLRSSQLWLADAGTDPRAIPQPPVPELSGDRAFVGAPVWSRDGTMLAIQWESCRIVGDVCETVEGVDVYDVDGRFLDYIDATDLRAGGIVWSPDSSRIGFTACLVEGGGPPPCPFGTNADGVAIHQFIINRVGSAGPTVQFEVLGQVRAWTAADRLLVSDTTGAYSVDTAGGNASWVLGPFEGGPEGPMDPPVWSSDGAMLAWALRDDPVLRIRDTTTGTDREVISFAGEVGLWARIAVTPVGWSPDDQYLAFYEWHREETEGEPQVEGTFYVVGADGQGLRRLDSAEGVSWRPAGD